MLKFPLRKAKVYTMSMEGEAVYIGKVSLHLKRGGCAIYVPDSYYKLSPTGKFCIEPGFFVRYFHPEWMAELVWSGGRKCMRVTGKLLIP